MIRPYDFIDPNWTYLARTLNASCKSLDEQFQATLKVAKKNLAESKTSAMKFKYSEIIDYINHCLETITNAAEESDMIWNLSQYLLINDMELAKIYLHIKYMFLENSWLKSEMYELQGLLMKLEHEFLIADAKKRFFQYFYNMRNYSKETKTHHIQVTSIEGPDDDDSDPEEEIPQSMNALFHVVMQFISESRHMAAISWCLKSVEDYQRLYGEMSNEVGAIYTLLGRIYKDFGYYVIAQDILDKALIIRERVHGKKSDHVAITLSLLGSVLGKREMYKEAISVCKQALTIRENSESPNQLEISRLNLKLAEYSMELKLWKESIGFYKSCLVFLEGAYDLTDYCIIKTYTNLAKAYTEIGVLNKAAEYLEKVNMCYVKKNNPGASNNLSPFAVIQDCLNRKVTEFPAEVLMQRFGSVSEISDDKVIKVMIRYFEKLQEPKTVELLQSWLEISNRYLSQIEMKYSKLNQPMSSQIITKRDSTSSQILNLHHSILSMFKGKK